MVSVNEDRDLWTVECLEDNDPSLPPGFGCCLNINIQSDPT